MLTSHSYSQRNKIEKTYKYNHRCLKPELRKSDLSCRRNLANDLRSKLSSHFERLCLALLQVGWLLDWGSLAGCWVGKLIGNTIG